MIRSLFFTITISLLSQLAFSQIGGRHAFEFVNLPNNAHVAGLGGLNISLIDQDVNLMFQNPALLNETMDRKLALNYIPYYGDIKGTSLGYARKYKKHSTLGAGLQFTRYGRMDWTDETGNSLGTFSPYDFYLYAGGSHTIKYYTLGASLRFASSKILTNGASAFLLDLGGVFKHPKKDLSVALAIKGLGFPVNKYTKGEDLDMPFDIQAGVTFKPEHMPLRISITAHHLYTFDIVYLDPNKKAQVDLEGNEIKEKKTFADKLGRHFNLGGEFLLGKNFHILFGYNYLRRRELRLQTKSGAAGFSFGGMMRIKSFEISFSRAIYHAAGGSNYLTIVTDLNRLISKKTKSISPNDGTN